MWQIFQSIKPLLRWIARYPDGAGDKIWRCSMDGSNIVAACPQYPNGKFFRFNGFIWDEQRPPLCNDGQWVNADISGNKMVAVNWSRLYYYDGASWSKLQPTSGDHTQLAIISGNKIFAKVGNTLATTRLYLYDGTSWSEQQPAGDSTYAWGSMDMDGDNIIISMTNKRLYFYNGSTWVEQQPAGDVDQPWAGVGISGNKLVAAVYGGRLYYHDGSTWLEQQPAGDIDTTWNDAKISGDAILAGVYHGRLYYYNGSTWLEERPAGDIDSDWYSVDISGNLKVAANVKVLYTYGI
jgi:hypothetical protein